MASITTVRQATYADKTAIFDFLQQPSDRHNAEHTQFPRFKIPNRWRWQFKENPFCSDRELPVWIALDGTKVVGQSCAMIEPLKVGSQELKVGWSVDTFVLPEYRGCGLGGKLQELNQNSHDVFMSIKMSSTNARIKARLGSFTLPEVSFLKRRTQVDRHTITDRLRKSSRLLANVASASGAASIAATIYSKHVDRCWTQETIKQESDLTFREVICFGNEIRPLWHAIGAEYDLLVCREPEYLNWKFTRQPHMNHHRFLAYREGRVIGYLILRQCRLPEPNVGVIVDLVALPHDDTATRRLIIFAVDWFRNRNVAVVKSASSVDRLTAAYQELGFTGHRRLMPMCHLHSNLTHLASSNWQPFFSYGDHDLDQFPNID